MELGQDVVVLLDSMTRLARAYNIAAPLPAVFFPVVWMPRRCTHRRSSSVPLVTSKTAAALTIISSALVETGSKMDEVIFEEFKGTGNMELRLSRELADKRLFPAIDVNASRHPSRGTHHRSAGAADHLPSASSAWRSGA